MSQHACGRALDLGVPSLGDGSADHSLGDPITVFLYEHSSVLGLTEDIFARVRYSARHPRGAYYGGVHPHNDHHHLSQTPAAASDLTYDQIVAAIGAPSEGDPMLEFSIGALGSPAVTGSQAKALQLLLLDRGETLAQFGADGAAGDETRHALHSFQTDRGMVPTHGEYQTGTVGPYTYTWLMRGTAEAVDLSGLVTKSSFDAHTHDEGSTGPPS